ncbi:dienelactone hydrolase family protein [Nitrospina watsonii]|uniref:Dienelactone hydrolase family protein n=1 Tax=Nitrospina watsonii TaxID=1323948 RepID=A0ABN8VZN6_9BACT|nr:dienelactone hydrolase family protein [Nitrospina watsonii]CAI2718808.1 Dienelactone hydrolase family protein [Nitrospina watsonii]
MFPFQLHSVLKSIFSLTALVLVCVLGTAPFAHAEVQTKTIRYEVNAVELQGFLAWDDAVQGKRPGILVVHEWWGHNEHARNRARMLAELGYTALALDMYGDGKLADHPKEAGKFMTAAFENWVGSQAKFNKAKEILQQQDTVDADRIGAIGFCFGGAVSIRMARGGADLDGVVAFHSALPEQPPVSKGDVKAPLLVINGSEDGFLATDRVAAFMKEMVDANADISYVSLQGVKHSYTNPQADEFRSKFNIDSLVYDKQAAERAWKLMQAFFERVFE